MKLKPLSAFACMLAIIGAHGVAQAGAISFNETTCVAGSATATSLTCDIKAAGASRSATMSAWSTVTSGVFSSATIGYYPSAGIGISGKNEPTTNSQHAMDNRDGTEAFLINFGSPDFALNQLSIGWSGGDADVSILRYTGTAAPSILGRSVTGLGNMADWDLVGDYATMAPGKPLSFNTGSDAKTASWWLVSTYNPGYSGMPASGGLTVNNDYFKLSGFSGDIVIPTPPPSQVPEPGSFALFGIALVGFVAARRHLRAK
ncbi:exosortase-dependent surface protein XDP1 [Massilia sp. Leaf139]|uniref:exosortase-dependent surface protein XDP1 n=1 Tax=Massilia sp. Leaf139 TaxID=1736272 RepID=UPI0009EC59F0|nr:exosortase-dependent surface protein XDP1 [Massilia sp. Leaf139]